MLALPLIWHHWSNADLFNIRHFNVSLILSTLLTFSVCVSLFMCGIYYSYWTWKEGRYLCQLWSVLFFILKKNAPVKPESHLVWEAAKKEKWKQKKMNWLMTWKSLGCKKEETMEEASKVWQFKEQSYDLQLINWNASLSPLSLPLFIYPYIHFCMYACVSVCLSLCLYVCVLSCVKMYGCQNSLLSSAQSAMPNCHRPTTCTWSSHPNVFILQGFMELKVSVKYWHWFINLSSHCYSLFADP